MSGSSRHSEGTRNSSRPRQLIESYGGGGFKVAGKRYAGSLLILPGEMLAWPVTSPAEISVATLQPVLQWQEQRRILVVGCGRSLTPRPHGVDSDLRAAGIILEWMDTGAACRTYNVLLLEDREVAAALIAVE